ncbi:class I SAM-dependent methyltransferase [Actinobacteria bacterium YIM 96077]|uniref:SAM-dependent methyltransferase n=1 Tax=Phytoactinopolyspora halophila TaxID=1981511 RepID=A0A329QRZ5_9ACTN|nr:class I SAM-dependent methyltransferase [Phytoactinopolyspora halophila]AYY14249.1 class I SAM-dependent methyltransferase [Actinobacteria bacterium YIM 96077]RAW14791.1 SAM-dependent methyltransferase [Phytoactinopolyspora halophila]
MRYADPYDAELRLHNEYLRVAADVRPRHRVLDIGCGTGQTTREAARVAVAGRALGVDISAPMLEHARLLSDDEGLRNVSFEQDDAQVHPFPSASFDLCISRFGTMFFADPVAAFTNIRRAMCADARLVLLVWQNRERNEWVNAVRTALTTGTDAPTSFERGPDAFSLGEPAVTEGILKAAGFTDVGFADVHEPVYYGPDIDTAYDFVLSLREPRELLATMDGATAERARQRLRALLAQHDTGDVFFDSRAWIITARCH